MVDERECLPRSDAFVLPDHHTALATCSLFKCSLWTASQDLVSDQLNQNVG